MLHIDGVGDADGGDDTSDRGDQQLVGLAVRRNGDPTEHLASALDLQRWVDSLPETTGVCSSYVRAGHTLEEAAIELKCSMSTVFSRCQQLGAQLAELAGVPVPKRAYQRRTDH